jgi:hypothetical protein
MMYVRACWLGSLIGSLMLPSLAAAHGFPPAVTQILMRAPNDVVLATSRGLVFGDPASKRWSLLCGGAFGAPDETPYRVVALPSRALLVASLEGLSRTDDDGCTWQPHATLGEADASYLLQDPSRPARVYVSVFRGEHAGIQASDDGGLTFRRLYEAPPDEFIGPRVRRECAARTLHDVRPGHDTARLRPTVDSGIRVRAGVGRLVDRVPEGRATSYAPFQAHFLGG